MSSKLTTDQVVKKVHVAEVVRHGDAFVVPEGLRIRDAIGALERLERMEEEVYSFTHTFEAFIWDGAVALGKAIENIFGFGFGERTGFFGSNPPELIEVATGPRPEDKVMVPWGRLSLPNIEGSVYTGGGTENGKFVFKLMAEVKRKHEKQIKALADEVRRLLATKSIYRGKAIKLKFKSNRKDPFTGEPVPNTPEFLNLSNVDENQLILNDDIQSAVSDFLFTPIDRLEDLRLLGIDRKRGVLLAGTFGTGKTLATTIAARKAQANGITYLLCENADEFADAVEFAKMYAPAVVSCEDIDRVLAGERNTNMDRILNIVDGVESKNTEVMVVLTTNNVEAINQAAVRPGRFDSVIPFEKPDAKSTARLIRLYAGDSLAKDVDVSHAAEQLKGNIPAVIAEAVKRAKLSQIRLQPKGTKTVTITTQAMLNAAKGMSLQLALLNQNRKVEKSQLEKAATIIGNYIVGGMQVGVDAAESRNKDAVEELQRNGKLRDKPSTLSVV